MGKAVIFAYLILLGNVASVLAQGAGGAKAFNPDVSVNLLGRYRYLTHDSNNRTDELHNGLSFEESEFQFIADVDPYFRASALFSLTQKDGTTDFGIDPEEVYFETLSLPWVTLRGGKFKAAFGKHNQLHTHAYPFIDAPLINVDLLGREGLNDMGVSAAVLLPIPWFSEITFQAVGTNNEVLYNSPDSRDLAPVGYFKNLFDLTDATTLEVGLYGTGGNNQHGGTSYAFGGDEIVKWRPVEGGKYHALIWQTEYQMGDMADNPAGEKLGGIASWLQWQFAQRWWLQGREEYEGIPHSTGLPTKHKQSGLLAFFPSEFSGFRLQYDHIKTEGGPHQHGVTVQYNISIGAHPAHAY